MMNSGAPFSKFEKQVQELIEGTFGRLLGGLISPQAIAIKLSQTMEESSYSTNGQIFNKYDVFLHPTDLNYIAQQYPDLETVLANYLVQLAGKAGLPQTDLPLVFLSEDDLLQQQQVRVTAVYDPSRDSTNTRQQRRRLLDQAVREAIGLIDAFLIVNGHQHVALDLPTITLGRRIDNDIVLESPAVSRKHAQIRWRYNHFIIYDMGSRAGVLVNGARVRECVLQPGDVIHLSDIALVYGEGASRRIGFPKSDSSLTEQTRSTPKTLTDRNLAPKLTEDLSDK